MPVAEHLTDTQTIARDHLFPSGANGGSTQWSREASPPGGSGGARLPRRHGWSSLLPWAASSLSLLQWLESWSPPAPAPGGPRSATAPSAGDSASSWASSSRWPASADRESGAEGRGVE